MGGKIRADAGTSFCGRKLNFISSVNQDHPVENRKVEGESEVGMEQVCNSYCTEWDKKGARSHMGLLVVLKAHMKLVTMNLHQHSSLTGIKKAKRFNPPMPGLCLVDNSQ